ncbi:MAG: bifunctional UDP-N-acetylglucosamine diphosphorylase/glucosamine-1-phosphate N-acetyltransferase GlmU, partial [Sciscionella sp.]
MRSATPKVLHPIGGRSLLGHAVHAVASLRPTHLAVVVGHARIEVSAHLNEISATLGRKITVAVQERQRGTGDAVSA